MPGALFHYGTGDAGMRKKGNRAFGAKSFMMKYIRKMEPE
ncbi:hypothetical protein KNP414_05302 [Paenibacillus mucilaginosus KNP414]|uniref:Uncharacterized protein n=1 Tax=Paenibacillus mucilaginosus (strain KNP414) TaxID=1036673 RepID=F8FE67_PAEMK|nr:hypothetical protein KNP414_05302 [Paenibacillus mucilaginosus KNP414]